MYAGRRADRDDEIPPFPADEVGFLPRHRSRDRLIARVHLAAARKSATNILFLAIAPLKSFLSRRDRSEKNVHVAIAFNRVESISRCLSKTSKKNIETRFFSIPYIKLFFLFFPKTRRLFYFYPDCLNHQFFYCIINCEGTMTRQRKNVFGKMRGQKYT